VQKGTGAGGTGTHKVLRADECGAVWLASIWARARERAVRLRRRRRAAARRGRTGSKSRSHQRRLFSLWWRLEGALIHRASERERRKRTKPRATRPMRSFAHFSQSLARPRTISRLLRARLPAAPLVEPAEHLLAPLERVLRAQDPLRASETNGEVRTGARACEARGAMGRAAKEDARGSRTGR